MSFLPIVERELRVRARWKSTYWLRTGGAIAAMLVVGFMLVVVGSGAVSPGRIGPVILGMLAWPAFLFCLLEGVRTTADCLSEEKRNGTLGLLFLTDLKGYDVVIGKLIATSLNSFYVLLGIFPLMALPLLMGGVMAGEFWRLALVLVNTIFLSLTLGLCVSSVSHREQRAWGATLGIMALLVFYPYVADLWKFLPKFPALFSPAMGFATLGDTTYRVRPGDYWYAVLCTNLLSWGLLFLASFLLPRTWHEKSTDSAAWGNLGIRWPWDTPDQLRAKRLKALARNPVLWLGSRRPKGQLYLWTVVGIAAVLALGSAVLVFDARGKSSNNDELLAFLWLGIGAHLLLAFWVAAQASYSFAESRSSGALELLLATPLSATQIIQGHFLSLRNMFLKPVLTLVCIELSLFLIDLYSSRQHLGWGDVIGLLFLDGMIVLLITDLYAAAWFGLWMGLTSKKPAHALTKTSLFVLFLPYLFCGIPCNLFFPIVGILKNWILIVYAQGQLNRRFRAVVTEQFTLPVPGTLLPAPQPPPLPPRLPANS